jgi:hypothetical protein
MGKKTKGQQQDDLQTELVKTRVAQAQEAISKILKQYNVSLKGQLSYNLSGVYPSVVLVANQDPPAPKPAEKK